jgi:hypothetical protein
MNTYIDPEEVEKFDHRAYEKKLWNFDLFMYRVAISLIILTCLALIFELGMITSSFIH